jgi:hypothetical protein
VLVLLCANRHCESTFDSVIDLEQHVLAGNHNISNVAENVKDKIKFCYIEKMNTEAKSTMHAGSSKSIVVAKTVAKTNIYSKMGWALKQRKQHHHLNIKQKTFILNAYIIGENSKRKPTSEILVQAMKTALNDSGAPLFCHDEYLTKQQIASQFSKLASKRKNNQVESYLKSTLNRNIDDEMDEEVWNIQQLEDEEYFNHTTAQSIEGMLYAENRS